MCPGSGRARVTRRRGRSKEVGAEEAPRPEGIVAETSWRRGQGLPATETSRLPCRGSDSSSTGFLPVPGLSGREDLLAREEDVVGSTGSREEGQWGWVGPGGLGRLAVPRGLIPGFGKTFSSTRRPASYVARSRSTVFTDRIGRLSPAPLG